MTPLGRILAIGLVLEISADRLPAPIIESPEPSTAPQQWKPKAKNRSNTSRQTTTSNSKPSSPPSLPQGPARFAGTWSGEVKQGLVGHVTATFVVAPDASTVQMSQNTGGGTHPATIAGNTISWPTGVLSATASFTINSDGQTANFVLKGMLGRTTSILRRTNPGPSTSASVAPQTPPTVTSPPADTQGYDTVALRPSGSMWGPKPHVPPEAREQNLSGVGIYVLHFDKPTGNLLDVTISKSSGSTILDQAAIATLRQWRATPGCPREVPFTVTFATVGP